jgi:hypothetical protein
MVDFSSKLSASCQPASQPASPPGRSAPPPSPPPPDDPDLRAGHAVQNDQSARARVLFDLPDDVLVRILGRLKPGEQKPALAVSKRMNRVARQAVQKITVSDTENLSAALPRFAKGGLKRISYTGSHVVTPADWALVHSMQLWRGRGWIRHDFQAPERLERKLSLMLPVHGVRQDIRLSGHRIRDQELWLLASEKGQALGIHELHLNGCPSISDAGLAHITKLRDLRVLKVTGGLHLSDSALERLKNELDADLPLIVIREHTFDSSHALSQKLAQMRPSSDIKRHIALCGQDMRDEDLWLLRSQALGLEELHLKGCTFITNTGLEHLAKLRNLRVLRVTGCPQLTDAALERLKAEFQPRDPPLAVIRATAQS